MAFSDSGGGWDDDDVFGNKAHLDENQQGRCTEKLKTKKIYDGDLPSQAESCQMILISFLIQGTKEQPRYITDNGKKNYECFQKLFKVGRANLIHLIKRSNVYRNSLQMTFGQDFAGHIDALLVDQKNIQRLHRFPAPRTPSGDTSHDGTSMKSKYLGPMHQ